MENNRALGMPSQAEFALLVKEANAGAPGALDRLRAYLDDHPDIWRNVGDLSRHAQESLVRAIAGDNQLLAESLRRKAAELRGGIGHGDPTPIEQLAIERVVAAWLELQYIDARHPGDAGQSLPMARYVVQLKDSAQRRFDAAIKCLSLVREKLVSKPEPVPEIKLRRKKKTLKFPMRAAQ